MRHQRETRHSPLNPETRHYPALDARSRAPTRSPDAVLVVDGVRFRRATPVHSAPVHPLGVWPGGTVTVQPGPGERAERPVLRRAPTRGTRRAFQEPVEAWLEAGTEYWWRVRIDGLPPPADRANRRRVYSAVRNAWYREVGHQRKLGKLEGEFASQLVELAEGVTDFTWGPAEDVRPAGPGEESGEPT